MARLTISRILDVSKTIATASGKEIQDFVEYVADVIEQTLRALRSGLTFQDNFNCLVSTVSLEHNVAQIVNTNSKQPIGVIPTRVTSSANYALDSFEWHLNASGDMSVTATFVGSPAGYVGVTLVILFN